MLDFVDRISIQHVSLHLPRKVHLSGVCDNDGSDTPDGNTSETKIYAISSEGGNVIYHISSPGSKMISRKTSEELRTTYSLTAISDGGAGAATVKAGKNKLDTAEIHYEKVNPADLNLRINPFGSDPDLDHVDKMIFDGLQLPALRKYKLDNAKRLDQETCKKEGIFFDEGEPENEMVAPPKCKEQVEPVLISKKRAFPEAEVTSSEGGSEVSVEPSPVEIVESIVLDIIGKVTGMAEVSEVLEDQRPILQGLGGDNGDSRMGSTADLSVQEGSTSDLSIRGKSTSMQDLTAKNMSRGRLGSAQSKDTMSLGPDELLNAIESKISEIDSEDEADGASHRRQLQARTRGDAQCTPITYTYPFVHPEI